MEKTPYCNQPFHVPGVPKPFNRGWYSTKMMLAMKLTFLLLTTALMNVYAYTAAQTITLKGKNIPFKQVISEIERQTGFVVFTTKKLLNDASPISVTAQEMPLTDFLDIALKEQPLRYQLSEKTIMLMRKEKTDTISPAKSSRDTSSNAFPVSGLVTDALGKGIPGASIAIKGTQRGVVSNPDGSFTLPNVATNSVLVISMVGYESREVVVKGRSIIAQLNLDVKKLDETIVVGYGTQKKVNLTGSVASVSGATITQRPAANLPNLLQGRIAGLTVVQPSGEPGLDQGSLQIRGLGSYGANSAPLVLVDGVAGSLNNLSPQDIASVTVLKDAASGSIYGARAANGVILVTTKSGKRGTNILEYANSFGITSATRLPELISNSATYMTMFNQARQRNGGPAVYTQAQIDAYKNGNGNAQFPNTDWAKFYFHSAPIQNHNLVLSGGDSLSTYYISAGYLSQKGVTDGYKYDRYNSQINYTRKVNKRIGVGTNVNLSYENSLTPFFTRADGMILLLAQAPTFSKYLPDGSGRVAIQDYSGVGYQNRPLYIRTDQGRTIEKNYNINAQAYLNFNVIKGLDWKTTGALVFFNNDHNFHQYPTPYTPVYAFQPDASGNYAVLDNSINNNVNQSSSRALTLTVNSTLNYQWEFGTDHHFDALAGYEQISNTSSGLGGSRSGYTTSVLHVLDAGPISGWRNNGNESQYSLRSLFGRVSYNFMEKYLVEGDVRYDGTSRVAPANRWGTFGGLSAGWKISEEEFIKKNVDWLSNLKIRASYGVLGNQEIGNYPYQAILSNTQYPFGTTLSTGVTSTALVDPNLRWEQTATADVGLDINIFGDLFSATIDWYNKKTSRILAQQGDVPASVGLSAPIINAGAMMNKGWEVAIAHQNHIGRNFTYGANIIFALNHNKVTEALNPVPGVFQVGLPFNSFYLYKWDGIFNSQEEINKSPAQPNSGVLKPGDLKIRDVNGDGQITPDDRTSISPFPKYTYSFGINAGYKGFVLTAFFQGVKGQNAYAWGWGIDPFFQGGPPSTRFLNAWTPENHSQTVPAVYEFGYPGVDGYNSTYFLQDASYLRLKNINLSYSFSKSKLKRIGIKDLTVFISGDNIITWTKFLGTDPERVSNDGLYASYPQIKTYSAGLKVSL